MQEDPPHSGRARAPGRQADTGPAPQCYLTLITSPITGPGEASLGPRQPLGGAPPGSSAPLGLSSLGLTGAAPPPGQMALPSAPPGRGNPGALTTTPKACLTCTPSALRAPIPPWPCPGAAGPPRAPAHGLGGRTLHRDRGRAVAEGQHGPVMPTVLSGHALSEHTLLHALMGSHTREDKPYRFIAPATRVNTEKLDDPEN